MEHGLRVLDARWDFDNYWSIYLSRYGHRTLLAVPMIHIMFERPIHVRYERIRCRRESERREGVARHLLASDVGSQPEMGELGHGDAPHHHQPTAPALNPRARCGGGQTPKSPLTCTSTSARTMSATTTIQRPGQSVTDLGSSLHMPRSSRTPSPLPWHFCSCS